MLGQEVQVDEVHLAAHPPARFVIARQRAEQARRAVARHLLPLGAVATVEIARQRVMPGLHVDRLAFLGDARPFGDRELVAEPRETFERRVCFAQRAAYRLQAERRGAGRAEIGGGLVGGEREGGRGVHDAPSI